MSAFCSTGQCIYIYMYIYICHVFSKRKCSTFQESGQCQKRLQPQESFWRWNRVGCVVWQCQCSIAIYLNNFIQISIIILETYIMKHISLRDYLYTMFIYMFCWVIYSVASHMAAWGGCRQRRRPCMEESKDQKNHCSNELEGTYPTNNYQLVWSWNLGCSKWGWD